MQAFLLFAILGRTIPSITHFDKIFVRSGYMHLPGNDGFTYRLAGLNADYWSSLASDYTSVTSATAYRLVFHTSVERSYGPRSRWHGFPLRCLSTVLDMGRLCYNGSIWLIL